MKTVAKIIAAYGGLDRLRDNYIHLENMVGRFPQVYEGLKGHGAEGVVLKRRRGLYVKHMRPGVESRDGLKRPFAWDETNS